MDSPDVPQGSDRLPWLLPEAVRTAREHAGLSQDELEMRAGFGNKEVHRIERAQVHRLRQDTITHLMAELDAAGAPEADVNAVKLAADHDSQIAPKQGARRRTTRQSDLVSEAHLSADASVGPTLPAGQLSPPARHGAAWRRVFDRAGACAHPRRPIALSVLAAILLLTLGIGYTLRLRSSAQIRPAKVIGALLPTVTPTCPHNSIKAGDTYTPPHADWSFPFPSAVDCSSVLEGMRIRFVADPKLPDLRSAEDDLQLVNGLAVPQDNVQIQAQVVFPDRSDTATSAGVIALTPSAAWAFGGFILLLNPAERTWRLLRVDGATSLTQVAGRQLDADVNVSAPVTLALQVHAQHIFPLINGRWTGRAVPIPASMRSPQIRVDGLFVDCRPGPTQSAPVVFSAVSIFQVHA